PEEFADDMRFVFSQGLLYPSRDVVHKIAMKFCETFENKWKSLNEEWTLEERKLKKIHKRKREQGVYDNERKGLNFQM
ncbi:transcription factor GTE12-like, partial [Trifolium medium]|nr:transcription factor GTE12-like [Trifolium medium]